MIGYAVNNACRLAMKDVSFRQALAVDPEATLRSVRPELTEAEVAAFLSGDVATLCAMGGHRYLLGFLARFQLFELDWATYVRRLREAYESDPTGRTDISP
jgi:hypothetical protein